MQTIIKLKQKAFSTKMKTDKHYTPLLNSTIKAFPTIHPLVPYKAFPTKRYTLLLHCTTVDKIDWK